MTGDDAPPTGSTGGIDFARLYAHRFRDVDQDARHAVRAVVARHLYDLLGRPRTVLDPAAGRGEFVDATDHSGTSPRDPAITVIISDIRDAPLPSDREYFDCADHEIPLTHVAVAEHLDAAGLEVQQVIPRYRPYSFRGLLPPSPTLTRLYRRFPMAWRVLGKQFLVNGRRP